MTLFKRIVAIAITTGFLAATGCSYRTCPTYTKNTHQQQPTNETALSGSEALAD